MRKLEGHLSHQPTDDETAEMDTDMDDAETIIMTDDWWLNNPDSFSLNLNPQPRATSADFPAISNQTIGEDTKKETDTGTNSEPDIEIVFEKLAERRTLDANHNGWKQRQ